MSEDGEMMFYKNAVKSRRLDPGY